MSKPILCCSDVHGHFNTLLALLDKTKTRVGDFDLYLLGDLIDRGPRSKQVAEYAIRNKIPTTKGNHEDLAQDHYHGCIDYLPDTWRRSNGGQATIKSWHGRIPREIVVWMKRLPLYIIPKDYPNLLLSHTGHGTAEDVMDALWCRTQAFPNDDFYRIFGHVAIEKVQITDKWAAIDTGCSYGGPLSGFVWPSKEVITQENID